MLIELDLMENSLTGSLPREIGQLYQLETLRLGTNTFSGLVPPELFNISTLGFLSLTDSVVSATLPTNLCNTLPVVKHLLLSANGFGGPIPVSISNCSNLKELALSYNHFTGFIPHFLSNPNLEYMDLSSNSLRVESSSSSSELSFITSLTNCRSLNTLAFAENSVEGTIPASIGNLSTSLQNFIAYNCRIRGAIPLEIGNLRNLITLALYDNELSGNIPVNLKSLDKLQALFLDSNGLGGSIMDGLCGLNRLVDLSLSDNQFTGSIPNLGNFSSLLKLDLSLNSLSGSLPLEIGSLVAALEYLHHGYRNLTKVISSCSNLDFRSLVLEYMPEGSLEKWLYSHNYCLDFMQRLNIMIDVISALEYLHHGYSTPIAHCDLKPSNVLLDEDMIGHVSDFGIAKLFGNGESTLITNTLATLGYIAPEYGLEGLVSTRCDMYSYGVMLMETFTRKRPSDDMFTGDLSLKNWIESSLPDSSYEVIDSNLLMNINEIQFAKTVECVTFVLVLASKCSVESPGERINMKEALAELQKIKRRFLQ